MLSKSQLRTRLEFIGLVMATSSIVGMIIAASVTDGPLTALVLVMGAAQGVVIGLGCSGSEVLILSNPSLRLARRFPPLVIVLLRALLYSAAILLGLSLAAISGGSILGHCHGTGQSHDRGCRRRHERQSPDGSPGPTTPARGPLHHNSLLRSKSRLR